MTSKSKSENPLPVSEEPIVGYGSQPPLSFEKVWAMFQETDKKFQDTDKKFQETNKKFQETDNKIKTLSELFTSQWGHLVESLVEGSVIRLFREIGIDVHHTSERVKGSRGGENFEFDILAHNEETLVVIEVKTTLRPKDVKDFIARLKKVKDFLPQYHESKVMGGVAFLKSNAGAQQQALNNGLYVIKATGDSAKLMNPEGFKPRIY